MSSDRQYTVGLPVLIEVADDGTVTFSVDLSEAPQSIWDDPEGTEDEVVVAADEEVIDDAVDLLNGYAEGVPVVKIKTRKKGTPE
jgi:hypothetical protein